MVATPSPPGAVARRRTKPAIDDTLALAAMAAINRTLVSIGGSPNDALAAREVVVRMRLARGRRTAIVADRLRGKYRRQRAALMAAVHTATPTN